MLSVFFMNIISLKCNFDNFVCYLSTSSHLFDIIVLVKTWLIDDIKLNIEGYQTLHSLGFQMESVYLFITVFQLIMFVLT